MISTVFENDYVEVITRRQAKFMIENFIKTCDCNWDNETCYECISIDYLKFQLEADRNCNIFVRFKFNKDDDRKNFVWSGNACVNSISEYVKNELKTNIESVENIRKLN